MIIITTISQEKQSTFKKNWIYSITPCKWQFIGNIVTPGIAQL